MTTCSEKEMPTWVKNIDGFGRKKCRKDYTHHTKKGENVSNIIFGLIFLWIVNKVPDWNLPFIRDNYNVVLWALNLSILIKIGANLLMLLLDMRPLRYFLRMVIEAAAFVANIVIFYIYPFDFSHYHNLGWFDNVLPILLIISMVVSGMKVLSNFWKMVFWREK